MSVSVSSALMKPARTLYMRKREVNRPSHLPSSSLQRLLARNGNCWPPACKIFLERLPWRTSDLLEDPVRMRTWVG